MGTPAATAQRAAPSKMSLKSIRVGKRTEPDRIVLAGVEGIGKSTFAADAPAPIFLAAEDGVSHLNVASFQPPETFADVIAAIDELIRETHEFCTVVVDTLDWLEPIIWRHVCATNKWDNIETPGYGKGYALTVDTWRELLAKLEHLQRLKGMEVILLAHTEVKTFSNPAGQDFSRYQMKLHRLASALCREWARVCLFAMHEEFARKDKGETKVKGVSTGRRVIYTQRTAAYDAKNRYGLPPELPLNYAEYAAARERGNPADPGMLYAEAMQLLDDLAPEPEKRKQIEEYIANALPDGAALSKVVDRLRSLIAEKENA